MQTRIVVLSDAWDLLKFLSDAEFSLDEKSAGKELKEAAVPVLTAALGALEDVSRWETAEIEAALRQNNQQMAFEPPDLGPLLGSPATGNTMGGTIGGAIACNLAGPRRPKAGAPATPAG